MEGKLETILRRDGKILVMTFTGCKVTFRERVLFEPGWGPYDMAVGEKIISSFSGPADENAYGINYPVPEEKTHKLMHDERSRKLHSLYQSVRDIREKGHNGISLSEAWDETRKKYPEEWLLPLEIVEILDARNIDPELKTTVINYLKSEKSQDPDIKRLVDNGLLLING